MIAAADKPNTVFGELIDEYVARGVFRAAPLPAAKKGVESFRIVWFQDQTMTLAIDANAKEARLMDVLPPIESRSAMDRQLRAWLKERANPKLPAHRRLDPKQVIGKFSARGGRIQLTMTAQKGDLVLATRKLLQFANELYLDFLSAPAQYNWIVETFELDPDNPQWP